MEGAGGPFKVIGLRGSAGFSGGTSGGGSGNPRPITISSMFKIPESILVYWVVSTGTHNNIPGLHKRTRQKQRKHEREVTSHGEISAV